MQLAENAAVSGYKEKAQSIYLYMYAYICMLYRTKLCTGERNISNFCHLL